MESRVPERMPQSLVLLLQVRGNDKHNGSMEGHERVGKGRSRLRLADDRGPSDELRVRVDHEKPNS